MTINEIPEARVIGQRGNFVLVICAYCGRRHGHKIYKPGPQRFAPLCGLALNPEDRATGYRFFIQK